MKSITVGRTCPLEITRSLVGPSIAIAVALLAVSSYIEIPMVPVPITAQTYLVLSVGAILGPVIGTIAVILWLAGGAIGLPVLAGGASGYEHFVGPTAGFLFAFPIAALLIGIWVSRRHPANPIARAMWVFAGAIASHIVCLGFGVLWLSSSIGLSSALENGFYPFIIGGIIKSVAVALTVAGIENNRSALS